MEPISLETLATDHLATARRAASGRAARTIHGGNQHALRQTILALAAGSSLADHESPGEATLQILRGQVCLTTSTDSQTLSEGDHVEIPAERHGLAAITDSVVLLTIARRCVG